MKVAQRIHRNTPAYAAATMRHEGGAGLEGRDKQGEEESKGSWTGGTGENMGVETRELKSMTGGGAAGRGLLEPSGVTHWRVRPRMTLG